jgi:cbb3-type cytochrome oxidase subunit 3
MEWLMWFTQFENTKPLALVIFFATFCGILFYVFGSRPRSDRLESYKNMPFQDENQDKKGN